MKIHTLSKRESREVFERLNRLWPVKIARPFPIEAQVVDENRSILVSKEFAIVKDNELLLPFLRREDTVAQFPRVVVDQGAVPFLCNGADVMRPGIVRFEGSFSKDDIVAVQEARHGKFIAVGVALIDSEEASSSSKGPVLMNLHFVGDKFWEASRSVLPRSM